MKHLISTTCLEHIFCDSQMLAPLVPSNEYSCKQHEGDKGDGDFFNGQRWKRSNGPARNSRNLKLFQSWCFLYHQWEPCYPFILNAGGVGTGGGRSLPETAERESKLRIQSEWGVNIISPTPEFNFVIRLCFYFCLIMPFGCYLAMRFYALKQIPKLIPISIVKC